MSMIGSAGSAAAKAKRVVASAATERRIKSRRETEWGTFIQPSENGGQENWKRDLHGAPIARNRTNPFGRKKAQKAQKLTQRFCAFCAFLRLSPWRCSG